MRVDTMRKIDYWAGLPLCFLVTLALKLRDLLLGAKAVRPKNVLFVELSEMGSAIIVDPAMRKMAAAGANLHFVIFKSNAASLRLLNTVPEENVFTLRADGLVGLAVDTLRFLAWTRSRRIDTVIDLELFSRFTALLTGLSGAANRVGYHAFHNEGLYRGAMLTRKVAYNPHIHIAKNFVALVDAAIADEEQLPFTKRVVADEEVVLARAAVSEEAKQAMLARVREDYPQFDPVRQRIVLINPNASDLLPQRRWMPEYFIDVMQRVIDTWPDVLVLITGAPPEREQAEGLKVRVGRERCVNFAGRVKFSELPALYTISTMMLTNDSGPGHFSAVTPLRTFVIFGPETPALYGSLGNSTPIFAGLACSPCVSAANHRKTPCSDNVCLKVIQPEQVFATIRTALDARTAQSAA
jgi:ADP-heptose:LPS heptosyltransferase